MVTSGRVDPSREPTGTYAAIAQSAFSAGRLRYANGETTRRWSGGTVRAVRAARALPRRSGRSTDPGRGKRRRWSGCSRCARAGPAVSETPCTTSTSSCVPAPTLLWSVRRIGEVDARRGAACPRSAALHPARHPSQSGPGIGGRGTEAQPGSAGEHGGSAGEHGDSAGEHGDPAAGRLGDGDVDRRLRPAVQAQLGQHNGDRVLDRLLGDAEPRADLAIGEPATDLVQHLLFARSKGSDRVTDVSSTRCKGSTFGRML